MSWKQTFLELELQDVLERIPITLDYEGPELEALRQQVTASRRVQSLSASSRASCYGGAVAHGFGQPFCDPENSDRSDGSVGMASVSFGWERPLLADLGHSGISLGGVVF